MALVAADMTRKTALGQLALSGAIPPLRLLSAQTIGLGLARTWNCWSLGASGLGLALKTAQKLLMTYTQAFNGSGRMLRTSLFH